MAFRSGEWTREETNKLSGNCYIACAYPHDDGSRNYRNAELGRIPFHLDPRKCYHGASICPSPECYVSWTWDHDLLLWRTGAGRKFAELLDLNPDLDPYEAINGHPRPRPVSV